MKESRRRVGIGREVGPVYVQSTVFTLKENMEVVRRTFNSKSVKVRTKTNKSKVDLFTV